ncbi:MAG TPA: MFS transporter [Terriglobia bacterium]|jgi:MFS family permease|nr:MFS transporter [Terriglobia bacterium]
MNRRRWVLLALVFAAIVINYIDRGNLSVAAPAMMKDFSITPATMGVLLSAFFWTYAAFQIPAGLIVDRFGIRWSYTVGFLVWSLASAAIAISREPGDVIGMRAVLGLAEAIAPLASISFIRSNFSGKEQGLPTSIYIAGQNIGPALGVLVGALLLDKFGWRMMFAITGLGALIWVPCWLLAAPPDSVRAERPAELGIEDPEVPRPWTWRMLLANETFWAMALCILLSSYYWYFVLTWVPSYLIMSRGFSTLGMGRVLSTALFTMAAVNVIAGAAADRLAARIGVFRARLWFGVLGYVGTGAILLLLVTDRSWSLPILAFSLCATGIGNSTYWTIIQHASPEKMVGRSVGFLNTVSVAAGAVAPIVTGWILGPQKHFGPAIIVAGVCPVLAALCLLVAGSKGLAKIKSLLAGEAYSEN